MSCSLYGLQCSLYVRDTHMELQIDHMSILDLQIYASHYPSLTSYHPKKLLHQETCQVETGHRGISCGMVCRYSSVFEFIDRGHEAIVQILQRYQM